MSIFKKKKMVQAREFDHTVAATLAFPFRSGAAQQPPLSNTKATIAFKEEVYRKVLGYCLKDSNERGCFILGGISRYGDSLEVYAQKLRIPPDPSYKNRHGGYIKICAEYMLKLYDEYEFTEAQAIVAVHSHPFSQGIVEFSPIDLEAFHNTAAHCLRRKNGVYMSLVLGKEGIFSGIFTTSPGRLNKRVSLKIIGGNGIRQLPETKTMLELGRLERQIPLFSEIGQQRIAATKLAVVGVGGVGSYFTSMAAHHGIANLILVDHDLVEESNLNRLAGAGWDDVGKKKVDIARKNVENISSSLQCRAVSLSIQDAMDELKEADVVASCVDNDEARLILQEFCARHYKPLIDFGAGGRVREGEILNLGSHVRIYYPGSSCICCMGLDPTKIPSESWLENRRQAGYIDGLNATPVQVVHINTIAASVGIKLLMWYLSGQGISANFIQYNSKQDSMTALMLAKHKTCPICGADGIEGMGDILPPDLTTMDYALKDSVGIALVNLELQPPMGRNATMHHSYSCIQSMIRKWLQKRADTQQPLHSKLKEH